MVQVSRRPDLISCDTLHVITGRAGRRVKSFNAWNQTQRQMLALVAVISIVFALCHVDIHDSALSNPSLRPFILRLVFPSISPLCPRRISRPGRMRARSTRYEAKLHQPSLDPYEGRGSTLEPASHWIECQCQRSSTSAVSLCCNLPSGKTPLPTKTSS
jgi:hypothetical protein